MPHNFDTDPIGCLLEYAYLIRTNGVDHLRRSWDALNMRAQSSSGHWHNDAMSKHRLLMYLVEGRDDRVVRQVLDRLFYKLELECLIEPYYTHNGSNEHFEYKQLTILGQELLTEGSYQEYLGGLSFVANKYKRSIVKIYHPSEEGIGTGFFIDTNRIATAKHVLEGLSEIEIALESGEKLRHKSLLFPKMNNDLDIAIIELEDPIIGVSPIRLAASCDLLEEVIVLGYPPIPTAKDAYLIVNRGEICARISLFNGLEAIIISCLLRGGNSGGPVINRRGQAVGVISRNLIRKLPNDETDQIQGLGYSAAFEGYWFKDLIECRV